MLFIDGGLVMLGLWLFCIIDVIATDEWRVRNLPKGAWLLIVLLIPDLGSIAWLVAGHPWQAKSSAPTSRIGRKYPEYDRPGRQAATNPDDDEAFLRQLRERAEAQRRKAAEQRRAQETRGESDAE